MHRAKLALSLFELQDAVADVVASLPRRFQCIHNMEGGLVWPIEPSVVCPSPYYHHSISAQEGTAGASPDRVTAPTLSGNNTILDHARDVVMVGARAFCRIVVYTLLNEFGDPLDPFDDVAVSLLPSQFSNRLIYELKDFVSGPAAAHDDPLAVCVKLNGGLGPWHALSAVQMCCTMDALVAHNPDLVDPLGTIRFGVVLRPPSPIPLDVTSAIEYDVHVGVEEDGDVLELPLNVTVLHYPESIAASPSPSMLNVCSSIADVSIAPSSTTDIIISPTASASSTQCSTEAVNATAAITTIIPAAELVLGRDLGRGGNAQVYHGRWRTAPVAIKVFKHVQNGSSSSRSINATAVDGSAEYTSSIADEVRMLRRWNHPGISRLLGVTRVQGSHSPNALVLELDGVNMSEWLKSHKPPNRSDGSLSHAQLCKRWLDFHARVCDVLAQVSSTLAHCHAAGVVHCDIKPGNIVVQTLSLTGGGGGGGMVVRAKLIDFGAAVEITQLAAINTCTSTATATTPLSPRSTHKLRGTARFMSPEAWASDVATITPGCDVYSVGVCAIMAFTGSVKWRDQPSGDINTRHMWQWIRQAVTSGQTPMPPPGYDPCSDVLSVKAMRRACPLVVVDVIGRCLSIRPTDRPSASDVAGVFAECARTLQSTADAIA